MPGRDHWLTLEILMPPQAKPRFNSPAAGLVYACFFLLLLGGCSPQPAKVDDAASLPLAPVQSPNDDKAYRYIQLDNGLRVLLISDPETEKAAASLDVYVGSASNPPDRGGLAHFLEHMLFLGTDKYPDSGEYATFISEHGGSRNAYTGFEHTNYFFDIDNAHLEEALDRFAQFFISPRFDAEYVDREVNAVNAEYQMGLNTDARRGLDVTREVVNPDHPYSILGVGTADTLANRPGRPVRDDLLKFYEQYYSANLMALAVLGRESLDDLEAMVATIFSPIPNRDVTIPDIEAPLFAPESLPMEINIRPVASNRTLMLSFPMPDYRHLYHAKPLVYIGNLLGHEGEGSLLSLLKAEGWAEGLGAGAGLAYRGGAAFNISINLTEAGMRERDAVIGKVFEYIRMLQLEGPQHELYVEQGQLSALQFRFRETVQPISYVSSLTNDMHMLAPVDTLQGNYLMTDYEPRLLTEIINDYFTPDNVVITVTGQDVPVDRESQFYSTPYSHRHITEAPWQSIGDRDIDPRLELPAPNEFIAENVEMVPLSDDNPAVPALVSDAERLQVWFRQDSQFRIPKGAMYVSFLSSKVNATAADAAAAQLYLSLLQDAVNEFTYPAVLAGLNFSVYAHARGISLKVSGYNDKQLVLLERIVDTIENANLDTGRFDNIRADLVRSLENVKTMRAFQQVAGDARQLLISGRWDEEMLIRELQALTPEKVQAYADGFWASTSADVMLNGNYAASEVGVLKQALRPLLRHDQPAAKPVIRITRLAPGDEFVYDAAIDHADSVMFWYLQGPDDDLENRALAALSGQVISSAFFEDLRTQQQLGYVVSAFPWAQFEVPGVVLMVQSPGASATEVMDAANTFLLAQAEEGAVTDEQFKRHQAAMLRDILQPHKNLWEEAEYFWQEIAKDELDFKSRERLADAVRAIDFAQWQEWYRRVMVEERASLVVVSSGQWGELPAGEPVTDPPGFREAMPNYLRD
jgi:secreted Zn-dependent insulinase-like peptidase